MQETINPKNNGERILLIDIARFYALVLVYYGHLIERVMNLGEPAAALHYKFIYSFHMPLFFLLSGYISKREDLPFCRFLKTRLASRIVPLIFFNLVLVALSFVFSGDFFLLDATSLRGYLKALIRTATGLPVFNIITWFFFMLFTVEILNFFVIPYLKGGKKILIAALCFYVGGWLLNSKFQIFHVDKVLWNFWYAHEAIVVYAFYLLGVWLRQSKILERERPLRLIWPALALTLCLVYFTYDLNKGPFLNKAYQAVVIVASVHGHILWFPLTAVIGSLFILLLAKVTPGYKFILLIGANAPIVFPLNGVFYHFVNGRAGKWMFDNLAGSPWGLFGVGSVVTVISLALCLPCIFLFNKYVPQLVGKPKVKGPIFNNFL
jgi:acyltransferase